MKESKSLLFLQPIIGKIGLSWKECHFTKVYNLEKKGSYVTTDLESSLVFA